MHKLIRLVTSSQIFAFFFILAFILVVLLALLTTNNTFWIKLSWWLLSTLGIFITLTAFVSHSEATQSKRWPKVAATLISTGIRATSDTYAPVATYKYSYHGVSYTGNTIDYSARSGSENWANKIIQRLKNKGVALTASVNPEHPEISVLNPGVRLVHYLRYLVGPAMLIVGILAALEIITF